jgi:branched-chain amino acid transport system permease protein
LLFAARESNIFPSSFSLQVSINVLAVVIIGGMGSVPGVIVGAIALVGLPEMLRPIQDYRTLAFGAVLVAMMLIRPGGLMPTALTSLEARARQLRQQRAGDDMKAVVNDDEG